MVFPKDVDDLKALIHYATAKRQGGEGVSIAARVGGTCMSGGSLTESYVVDSPVT